jgi:hypothetical protein
MSKRFWLFRNYVDGVPQFLAFDNPYPCHPGGDPMTLGAPYGVAFFVESDTGREWSDQQVMNEIRTARAADLQARDLNLADLVRALPHAEDCDSLKIGEAYGLEYRPGDLDCNCPRGELLAMLRETK